MFHIHNIFKFVEKFLEKFYYHKKIYMSFKSVFNPLSIDIQNFFENEKKIFDPQNPGGGYGYAEKINFTKSN